MEYVYQPERNSFQPVILSVCSMAAGFLLYGYAGYFITMGGMLRAMLQLVALGVSAVGIYLLIRYHLTSFRYELHDDNFIVVKIVGKKEMTVCDLTLKSTVADFPKDQLKQMVAEYGPISRSHNFVVNFQPMLEYVHLFRDADSHAAILFEPDEAFLTEMKKRTVIPNA